MKHLIIILLLFYTITLSAQPSILAERIDIRITEKPLEEVLQIISKTGGFFFSYNAAILSLDRNITLDLTNTPVRDVLDKVIDDPNIRYKEIGNHVILNKIRPPKEKLAVRSNPNPIPNARVKAKPTSYTLSGFVVDSITGRRLAHASVYEHSQSVAAVSDQKGFYRLKLTPSKEPFYLSIKHRFYEAQAHVISFEADTTFTPKLTPRSLNRVASQPILLASTDEINPIQDVFLVKLFVNSETLSEPFVRDRIETRLAQISFIPPASTSGMKSGQKANHASLNVLVGYSAGLKGVEIGGLLNIDRDAVHGVQIGGLGNVVGGNTNGVQIGGLFNVNRRSVKGAQIAGINNWADSLVGVQFSPINNVLKGHLEGIQATAIANVSVGEITGIQVSGIVNTSAGEIKGLQGAGIANWGKRFKGAQLAGIVNVSMGDFSGVQAAGILNVARKGKGFQIGLVNVSDSLDGVAIGLINIVNKGYNGIEVVGDLALPLTAKLKTGNHWLYNIFAIGSRPGQHDIWGYGYGLGTAIKATKTSYIHTELLAWQIHQDQQFISKLNVLAQLQMSYHLPLSSRFELSFGPVLNYHASNYVSDETGFPLSGLASVTPGSGSTTTEGLAVSQFRLSGQIGITLLKHKRDGN